MCRVSGSDCVEEDRTCFLSLADIDKNICSNMKLNNPKAKCVYDSARRRCQEVCTKCEDYTICSGAPWLDDKNDFNYYYKCFIKPKEDSTYECIEERRNCTEYDGDDEATCISLRASNPDKRCVFDGTKTYGKCYEEYKSCKIYNDTIKDKTRAYCEAIKLLEPNQKCIYIYENDTCLVVNNYTTCEEYKGTDRTVCESIISPTMLVVYSKKIQYAKKENSFAHKQQQRKIVFIMQKPVFPGKNVYGMEVVALKYMKHVII